MIDSATILVADDSSDDVELLKRAIQKAGLKNPVRFLDDGHAVMEYLRKTGDSAESPYPLLMFLDLNMPRCPGFAVLDWLRQQPEFQNLPTIVFTNSELDSDREQSLRLGAHGYWVKPSRFEDLVILMQRLKEVLVRSVDKAGSESQCATPAATCVDVSTMHHIR